MEQGKTGQPDAGDWFAKSDAGIDQIPPWWPLQCEACLATRKQIVLINGSYFECKNCHHEWLTKELKNVLKEQMTVAAEMAMQQKSTASPSSSRLADFDRVLQVVNVERMAVYGHPNIDFSRVAKMKEVVAECKDPLVRHVLEMICVKVCRLVQTPDHLDSWQDIAGYARTGVMVTD